MFQEINSKKTDKESYEKEKNYSSALSVNTIEPDIREILIFTFCPGLHLQHT